MTNYDIIIAPILSEKSYDGIPSKKYTFKVAVGATKGQIKDAVEKIFGVKVKKVNTLRYDGKTKRMGRYEGKITPYSVRGRLCHSCVSTSRAYPVTEY